MQMKPFGEFSMKSKNNVQIILWNLEQAPGNGLLTFLCWMRSACFLLEMKAMIGYVTSFDRRATVPESNKQENNFFFKTKIWMTLIRLTEP